MSCEENTTVYGGIQVIVIALEMGAQEGMPSGKDVRGDQKETRE